MQKGADPREHKDEEQFGIQKTGEKHELWVGKGGGGRHTLRQTENTEFKTHLYIVTL